VAVTFAAEAARFIGQMVTDDPNEFITAVATLVVSAFTDNIKKSPRLRWRGKG
jgi:hypothetical protein